MVRADPGLAREKLIAWCETNGVDFVFGRPRNDRRVAEIEYHIAQPESLRFGELGRRFKGVR